MEQVRAEKDIKIAKIVEYMKQSRNALEFRRLQAIYLKLLYDTPVKQIANIVLFSESYIHQFYADYRKRGVSVLLRANNSVGGRHRSNMSIDEEKEILTKCLENGEPIAMINVKRVHQMIENKLKCKKPLSSTYRLLSRHGWHQKTTHFKLRDITKDLAKEMNRSQKETYENI